MSTASKGKKAEVKVKNLLEELGWTMAAKATNRGFYSAGRWIPGGAIDLLEGAVDFIHVKQGEKVLMSQVCHVGGESPRRVKLREMPVDWRHTRAILWAYDEDAKHFHLYRDGEDFLDTGQWRMRTRDREFPWDALTKQELL